MKKVAIIMGSSGDGEVAVQASGQLNKLGIPHVTRVLSAHRTPDAARDFARALEQEGYGAVIAFAGMAAHLAGALGAFAAQTVLPVIGVPVASGPLNGMDALLATVQMPGGIPVATVAVNGGRNAAILAAQILAVEDEELRGRLRRDRQAMQEDVLRSDREISGQ